MSIAQYSSIIVLCSTIVNYYSLGAVLLVAHLGHIERNDAALLCGEVIAVPYRVYIE